MGLTRKDQSFGLAYNNLFSSWANLNDIAVLTPTDGNFVVGDGSAWIAESGNTARTSLGLGTGDSPTWTNATLSGQLNLSAAISEIVPGITSLALRNNADNANNLILTDAGAATFRNSVGGITTLSFSTLGSAANLNSQALTNANIDSGNIDGTVVGAVSPAAGTFTALTGTSGSITGLTAFAIRSTGAAFDLTFATATIFTAGRTLTIDPGDAARTITLSGNPTLNDWFDQSVKTTSNPTFVNLTITSFAANWTNAGRTVADLGIVTTVDINGGTIDGTTIGGASAGAGTFTTLNATGGGALTGTWTNLGSVTTIDINGGTIDSVTLGSTLAGSPTLSGTITFSAAAPIIFSNASPAIDANSATANLTIIAKKTAVNTGTAITIQTFSNVDAASTRLTISGGLATAVAAWSNITHSGLNATSPTITTSPTAAGATWADLGAVTTIDINGGTIDGTTIGATTASSIIGTTIDATTDFTIGTTVITDDTIVMGTTANVVNSASTTVNFAGAATTINMGAAAVNVGIGQAADSTQGLSLTFDQTLTDDVSRIGFRTVMRSVKTSAAYAGVEYGIFSVSYVGAANTQSWTATIGLIGLLAGIQTNTGSTGTITGAAAIRVGNPTVDGSAITTNYGLLIDDQTSGASDYGIAIAGADTQVLWLSSGADNTDAANGIAFGSSRDTNLYRGAANSLRTDDDFVVGGDLVPLSGHVTFPAIQNPSADVNILDDYEEGTFTPGISFGGGTTGVTYDNQFGYYTKIGNMVHATIMVGLTSNGTSTGAVLITGLPFTVANVSGHNVPATLVISAVSFANMALAAAIQNTTTIALYESTEAGVQTVLVETDIADTAVIRLDVTYRI